MRAIVDIDLAVSCLAGTQSWKRAPRSMLALVRLLRAALEENVVVYGGDMSQLVALLERLEWVHSMDQRLAEVRLPEFKLGEECNPL